MQRSTPVASALRGYSAGGSRVVVDTIQDSPLMQSHTGHAMANEQRDGVESPQNYGFTSVCAPADKDEQGNIISSAETFYQYLGGNRTIPVCGPMDDRRHRLRGLSSGDVAMNRGKDDDMQIHLAGDGMYHSAPQMVRLQLVPAGSGKANPPQQQSQGSPSQQRVYARYGPHIELRLWAGLEPILQQQLDLEVARIEARAGNGGTGGSGGGQQGMSQGQQNKTGQKAVAGAGADSPDFMHVKKDEGRLSSQKKVRLSKGKEDDDVLHEANGQDGNDYVGGTPAKHKFATILTTAGPSKNGKARIG